MIITYSSVELGSQISLLLSSLELTSSVKERRSLLSRVHSFIKSTNKAPKFPFYIESFSKTHYPLSQDTIFTFHIENKNETTE